MNWDRINALSRFKEDRDSIDSVNVTPSELNAWIKKDHMEEVGALTPEEYETKKELQDLRRWWWWWEVQNGAIVDRIENGVAGNFEINGMLIAILEQSQCCHLARSMAYPVRDASRSRGSDDVSMEGR